MRRMRQATARQPKPQVKGEGGKGRRCTAAEQSRRAHARAQRRPPAESFRRHQVRGIAHAIWSIDGDSDEMLLRARRVLQRHVKSARSSGLRAVLPSLTPAYGAAEAVAVGA